MLILKRGMEFAASTKRRGGRIRLSRQKARAGPEVARSLSPKGESRTERVNGWRFGINSVLFCLVYTQIDSGSALWLISPSALA